MSDKFVNDEENRNKFTKKPKVTGGIGKVDRGGAKTAPIESDFVKLIYFIL
jgi:hypothetical protein